MKKSIGFIRITIGLLIIALLAIGCSKEVIEDEPVAEEPTPVQQPQEEPEVQPEEPPEPEPIVEETIAPVETPAVAETETLEEREGQLEEVLELISETDSVDIFYMVKPGDYLSLIAKNEYGNIGMWRMIYKWNRKKIGENPNKIYPFNEFLLKKPKDVANDLEFDYYDYVVKSNETLWSIARKEYDNYYAWIVILRDNAETLGPDINNVPAGTILKLRTKIFN